MEQVARLSRAIGEPRFVACQKKFQPAAGLISSKKVPGGAVEKQGKKDTNDHQYDVIQKFLVWHWCSPDAASATITSISLNCAEGKSFGASSAVARTPPSLGDGALRR